MGSAPKIDYDRDAKIAEAYTRGDSLPDIMIRFDISRARVYKILDRAKTPRIRKPWLSKKSSNLS